MFNYFVCEENSKSNQIKLIFIDLVQLVMWFSLVSKLKSILMDTDLFILYYLSLNRIKFDRVIFGLKKKKNDPWISTLI